MWNLQKSMYKEVAQTLQEARKQSRSLENVSASLHPLSEDSTAEDLKRIETLAMEITGLLAKLYNDLAPKAFGMESGPGPVRGGPTQA